MGADQLVRLRLEQRRAAELKAEALAEALRAWEPIAQARCASAEARIQKLPYM